MDTKYIIMLVITWSSITTSFSMERLISDYSSQYACDACQFFTENYSVYKKHNKSLLHDVLAKENPTEQELTIRQSWNHQSKKFCCVLCNEEIKNLPFVLALSLYTEHLQEHEAINILAALKKS